jgi:hypothetical protein
MHSGPFVVLNLQSIGPAAILLAICDLEHVASYVSFWTTECLLGWSGGTAAEHIKYGTDGCLGPGTSVDRSREDAFEPAKV